MRRFDKGNSSRVLGVYSNVFLSLRYPVLFKDSFFLVLSRLMSSSRLLLNALGRIMRLEGGRLRFALALFCPHSHRSMNYESESPFKESDLPSPYGSLREAFVKDELTLFSRSCIAITFPHETSITGDGARWNNG